MFYQTSMGLIYLIFNQLPFLWDTSDKSYKTNGQSAESTKKPSLRSVIHQLLFPIFLIGLILFTI